MLMPENRTCTWAPKHYGAQAQENDDKRRVGRLEDGKDKVSATFRYSFIRVLILIIPKVLINK